MLAPTRLDAQLIDLRLGFESYLGVDFGSDARVLAVRGLARLVWAKPTRTLMGMRGMGVTEQASTLQIRRFRREPDGRLSYDRCDDISVGGRLGKQRLAEHAETIDAEFGAGATRVLDPKVTLLFGEDVVGEYIVRRRAEPVHVPQAVLDLIEKAHTATVTKDDFGCKL